MFFLELPIFLILILKINFKKIEIIQEFQFFYYNYK